MRRFLCTFFLILIFFVFNNVTSFVNRTTYYDCVETDMKLYDICKLDEINIGNIYGDEFFFWKNTDYKTFYVVNVAKKCAATKIPYNLNQFTVEAAYYYDFNIYFSYRSNEKEHGVRVIDKNGKDLYDFKLPFAVNETDVYRMIVDDGKIYLCGNFGFAEFDVKGNMKQYIANDKLWDFSVGNGKLFYQKIVGEEEISDTTSKYKVELFETKLGEEIPVKEDVEGLMLDEVYCAYRGDSVIYPGYDGIYKYNFKKETCKRVIDIDPESIDGYIKLIHTDGEIIQFLLIDPYGESKLSKLYTYTPIQINP